MSDKGTRPIQGQAHLRKMIAQQTANLAGYVSDVIAADELKRKALENYEASLSAIKKAEVSLEASIQEFGAIDIDGILSAARDQVAEAERREAATDEATQE